MKITSWDKEFPYEDVSEIEIPFPDKKYIKILKICKLSEKSDLGPHQIIQIFVNSVYHFLLGHLSVDELACIAGKLEQELPKESRDGKLSQVLYYCSELSFYSRRIYSQQEGQANGNFEKFMNNVMKYYASHKSVIVKEDQ